MSYIWLVLAVLSDAYFVAMNILSPGTFLGTVFSFSAVWLWFSAFCFSMFMLRRRHLWSKLNKTAKVVILSVLGAGVVLAGVVTGFITHPKLSDGSEQPKYVILLGGGITKDKELTDSVKQRVKICAQYLKEHPEAVCVVTGGQGPFSPCPESDVLKPAVEAYGISPDRVLPEPKAKDTIQNFQYSAKVLAEYSNCSVKEVLESPVTVITNDFHIARAERLARRMGFTEIYGACAKTPVIFILNAYCREICCYIKLNLRIILTGKPERLDK